MIVVLFQITLVLLDVIWWIIFAQVLLSILISFNVINTYNEFVASLWTGLNRLTDPVYRPLRRILPDARPLDLAAMAALVILYITRTILVPYLFDLLSASGVA